MYYMTEYCPLIGAQYPVRQGQQLNTQFTRPFPPCGSGLARETNSSHLLLHALPVSLVPSRKKSEEKSSDFSGWARD